eukprot:2528461-Pyramimonas_sp.AAC.1
MRPSHRREHARAARAALPLPRETPPRFMALPALAALRGPWRIRPPTGAIVKFPAPKRLTLEA